MDDLIEKLNEEIEQEKRLHNWDVAKGLERAINFIKLQSSTNTERHAFWIDNGLDYRGANWFKCSNCGRTVCEHYNIAVDEEYPYCHCGCKMKKEII